MCSKQVISRILANEVVFLECDIQERIAKLMMNIGTVTHNARRCAKLAKLMNISYIATRQINFGDIVPELAAERPP